MSILDAIIKPILASTVRHAATLVAGALEAHGLATQDQGQQIAAGIVAVAAVGWSWWQKHQQAQAVTAALNTPPPRIAPK